MGVQVTITIPEETYEKAQQIAEAESQPLEEVLVNSIQISNRRYQAQTDALEKERDAYLAMHSQLLESYAGQYVAIYQGKLLDYDADYGALSERVRTKYPKTTIWVSQVTPEPIQTIWVRSPRFFSSGE